MLESKRGKLKNPFSNEMFLIVLCFLASAIVGYILTNHIALLGF